MMQRLVWVLVSLSLCPLVRMSSPYDTHLAYNCTLRDTCGLQHLLHDQRSYTCACDSRCPIYGDCCLNYVDRDEDVTADGPFRPTCRFLRPVSTRTGVYIVGECPEEYDDEEIKGKCESHIKLRRELQKSFDNTAQFFPNSISEVEGIIPFVPVSSNSTGVMFRNIYCSICNGVEDQTFWNVHLHLRDQIDSEELDQPSNIQAIFEQTWRRRSVTFDHPTLEARTCRINVIQDCPDGTEEELKNQCSGTTSRMFHRHVGTAYRNRHCAECHNVTESNMTCLDPLPHLITALIPPMRPLPYALLLDLNTGTAALRSNKVGYKKVIQDQDTNEDDASNLWSVALNSTNCSGQVFDPVYDQCSQICSKVVNPSLQVCTHGNMSTPQWVFVFKFGEGLMYVTLVGNVFSCIGLILLLFVYIWIPALRNTPGRCLMCLGSSLLVAQLLFSVGLDKVKPKPLCVAIAMFMHYCFLAQFCWMNVMAFDVWRAFKAQTHSFRSKGKTRARHFWVYSAYCWTAPAVVVTLSFILDKVDSHLRPAYGQTFCWFGNRNSLLFLFGLPVGMVLMINTGFFILTARNICHATEGSDILHPGQKEQRRCLFLYVKLAVIMGLAWIFGFLATAFDNYVLWYLFTIFNAFQGVFICLSFVFTQKVCKAIRGKLKRSDREKTAKAAQEGNDVTTGSRHTLSSKKTSLTTVMSGGGRSPREFSLGRRHSNPTVVQ